MRSWREYGLLVGVSCYIGGVLSLLWLALPLIVLAGWIGLPLGWVYAVMDDVRAVKRRYFD